VHYFNNDPGNGLLVSLGILLTFIVFIGVFVAAATLGR
jgi:hypothetical protein